MGGVIVTDEIYNTFMTGPESAIEFCHGYTYSGHPLAAAVGHVVLDIMESEDIFARVRELEPVLEEEVHSLKDLSCVSDIRNIGLTAAVDIKPIEGKAGARWSAIFEEGLRQGLLLRCTGDTVSFGPPFVASEQELRGMIGSFRKVLQTVCE